MQKKPATDCENPMTSEYTVLDSHKALRLDLHLRALFPEFSRTYFQYLIEYHSILVNGKPAKKSLVVCPGDEIEILFLDSPEIDLAPQNIPLEILYEDAELLAINKPAGMVVHPAPGHPDRTLVNALLYYCAQISSMDRLRPGIVHRLDKETSGVILTVKNPQMHAKIVDLFSGRTIQKKYLAITTSPKELPPLYTSRIGRHPKQRQQMASLQEGGKEAITEFSTLSFGKKGSLVLASPKTGRTHQIRVHLKDLGAPILGDSVYGPKKAEAPRHMLHAYTLNFTHPTSGKVIEIKAPLPQDFKEALEKQNIDWHNI